MCAQFSTILECCVLFVCIFNPVRATAPFNASGRAPRINLISFKPIGQQVNMGLDLEMPFMRVPMTNYTDKQGHPVALMNVNTAAVITTGILAAGGALIGHLFRSLGLSLEKPKPQKPQNISITKLPEQRADWTWEENSKQLFNNFKLVYTNATGRKIETTLPDLFNKMEHTFLENDMDLAACLQKSLCSLVYQSRENMRLGRASGVEKIVDGISQLSWLDHITPQSLWTQAIEAGKLTRAAYSHCDIKYPTCKWAAPKTKLLDLLRTYVRFT